MQGENGGVAVANQAAWNGREGGQNGWAVPISRALRACPDSYTPRPSFDDWCFPRPKGSRYDVDNFSQALRAANISCPRCPSTHKKLALAISRR